MLGLVAAAAGFTALITCIAITATSEPWEIIKIVLWFWAVVVCIGLMGWGLANI